MVRKLFFLHNSSKQSSSTFGIFAVLELNSDVVIRFFSCFFLLQLKTEVMLLSVKLCLFGVFIFNLALNCRNGNKIA